MIKQRVEIRLIDDVLSYNWGVGEDKDRCGEESVKNAIASAKLFLPTSVGILRDPFLKENGTETSSMLILQSMLDADPLITRRHSLVPFLHAPRFLIFGFD